MIKNYKDPFGGVHGETSVNKPSPFKIDKEEALREIEDSLAKWDQKKVVKKSQGLIQARSILQKYFFIWCTLAPQHLISLRKSTELL